MYKRFTMFRDTVTGEYAITVSEPDRAVISVPGYPNIRRIAKPFLGLLEADTVDKLANSWDIVILL